MKRITVDVNYAGFTDIEFNPSKSINCQAKSCALFVVLMKEAKLESYMASPDVFVRNMVAHTPKTFEEWKRPLENCLVGGLLRRLD